MARLQILQLPAYDGVSGAVAPPFILVIDQIESDFDWPNTNATALAKLEQTPGLRAILAFDETADIPANEIGEQTESVLRGDEEILRLTEERDELHAEIGLAHGQLHSAALSAIRGKHHNIRELIQRANQAEAERDEARTWARHGYEIGQRHCGWTDHGVAPDWLTEGWLPHFDSCEHLKRATEHDEALTRVRAVAASIRTTSRTWKPVADLIDDALTGDTTP